MRRRRRRSLWPVILIVLLLVLLALVAVFVSRVGGINVGELFRNTGNALKPNKAEQLVMATPSPVVWSPTPMPTATPVPTPKATPKPTATPVPTPEPTPVPVEFSVQTGRQIPIFSYYAVSSGKPGSAAYDSDIVHADDFSAQLQALKSGGFTTLTFEDLANLATVDKPVILTFDGLYAEIYTDAYPLLKQNNMKANVFVNPDYIGQQGRMTQAQLKEMADSGVMSLQCALNQYESLELVPKEEVRTRVTNAKNGVTAITGKEPIAFEYPVGSVDSHELEVCSSLFKFCLRRSGDRAYDTSRDSGSLIYQFTMQRDTPLAMFSFWAGKAK